LRYVHTVIARIYYCVNRSWSGKITAAELRRSNLLSVISYLEDEEDINQITDYFSYEHFYVIYCKFWELDTDHDLFIDKHDLAKHNERALSMPIIERIFSGAVTRGRVQKQERMGYQEFVWFLISEEDKRHP
ncbi:serine/threonine-protein phosphatase 2A regulatory subunit B'' subunit beta-like, partial [Hyalella azteca]|uniref:Serine/threonine-protein phosphatase 2A regulatory subunit B'' subunit beta-like n=1 Tax=Hyalella azteca TaxID=294128 RepID=A0A979FQC8_HYAAZ